SAAPARHPSRGPGLPSRARVRRCVRDRLEGRVRLQVRQRLTLRRGLRLRLGGGRAARAAALRGRTSPGALALRLWGRGRLRRRLALRLLAGARLRRALPARAVVVVPRPALRTLPRLPLGGALAAGAGYPLLRVLGLALLVTLRLDRWSGLRRRRRGRLGR